MLRGLWPLLLAAPMIGGMMGCAGDEAGPAPGPGERPSPGAVTLTSSDDALSAGFAWAKEQAMAYVFEGDPVGPWYEAALPGREAFCMRDVSHQVYGALVLGLWEHTHNMLFRFAENISPDRHWASYWEIDRLSRPAPVDYRSDEDFWYNLPANFDVVDASYRAFEWTGDLRYLEDPVFDRFHRVSLGAYVDAWDADGDGVMESPASNGNRGIPSYWEGRGPRALTGGDLVAAQFAANRALASMWTVRGDPNGAEPYRRAAARLQRLYNDEWWNGELGRFHTSILEGGAFDTTYIPLLQILPLYFGIVEPGDARERLLAGLAPGELVEVNVYLAETWYRMGRPEEAFRALMAQLDPELPRREYPENPFTAVGTTVRYLVGIDPRASDGRVETRPRLPRGMDWVEVRNVPTLGHVVAVRQQGLTRTRLTLQSGDTLAWRAVLPGRYDHLMVDGVAEAASHRVTEWGRTESWVDLFVPPASTRTVTVPEPS